MKPKEKLIFIGEAISKGAHLYLDTPSGRVRVTGVIAGENLRVVVDKASEALVKNNILIVTPEQVDKWYAIIKDKEECDKAIEMFTKKLDEIKKMDTDALSNYIRDLMLQLNRKEIEEHWRGILEDLLEFAQDELTDRRDIEEGPVFEPGTITGQLEQLREEIEERLERIKELIKQADERGMIYERARSYWLAHIEGALRKDSQWLGGSFINMDDTLREVEELEIEKRF